MGTRHRGRRKSECLAASKAHRDVAIDANDDIILAGYVLRDIDFGDGPRVSMGRSDLFVMKMAP